MSHTGCGMTLGGLHGSEAEAGRATSSSRQAAAIEAIIEVRRLQKES